MKRLTFFILLVSFVRISLNSQAQKIDHLEPVGSYLFLHARDLLNQGVANLHTIQILVIPSFGTESLLAIEVDTCNFRKSDIKRDNVKFNLVYYKIKYVNKEQRETQEIDSLIKYKKEISTSCVRLIEKLFDSAIKQTRYPGHFGLDGVNYIFTSGYGRYAGLYWGSGYPSKDTKLGKLVNIAHELFNALESKTSYIEFDKDFIIEIENLTEEFNSVDTKTASKKH